MSFNFSSLDFKFDCFLIQNVPLEASYLLNLPGWQNNQKIALLDRHQQLILINQQSILKYLFSLDIFALNLLLEAKSNTVEEWLEVLI